MHRNHWPNLILWNFQFQTVKINWKVYFKHNVKLVFPLTRIYFEEKEDLLIMNGFMPKWFVTLIPISKLTAAENRVGLILCIQEYHSNIL